MENDFLFNNQEDLVEVLNYLQSNNLIIDSNEDLTSFTSKKDDSIFLIVDIKKINHKEFYNTLIFLRNFEKEIFIVIMNEGKAIYTTIEAIIGFYIKIMNIDTHENTKIAIDRRSIAARVAEFEDILHKEYGFDEMIGISEPMMKIYNLIRQVAPTKANVLIVGESGTGKELVARSLHNRSMRSSRPFVTINCGAIPSNLIESELFGHEKGAFTGAEKKYQGKFQLADGGTLFVDEIGDLPKELQPKLLRAIEYQRFYPVGSDKESSVDVRIIAATNTDLSKLVEENKFREDLFYRLRVVQINIPPLRLRGEQDIKILIGYFWGQLALINNRDRPTISKAVIEKLVEYPWPGNVRELRNLLESMFIIAPSTGANLEHLPDYFFQSPFPRLAIPYEDEVVTLYEVEKQAIKKALEKAGGNRTIAAKKLGISVRTLQRKLKEYN
ncbi:MAG: sigma-54-dependent Fis family transcriptional regulator [Candidatus Coatesbacteria bacterium]|nr:sigma-54-dependent Fis family transcriptional regulator [Candidatus Coatesbacteria bacterium]